MTDLKHAKQNWEKGPLARTLKKAPERKPEFTASSGIAHGREPGDGSPQRSVVEHMEIALALGGNK